MKFLAILLLVGVAHAGPIFTERELDEVFDTFKANFGRQYETKAEEQQRKMVFASNYELIIKHNLEADMGMHTYRLGVNNFADLTNKEFRRLYNGYRESYRPSFVNAQPFAVPNVALNATVDWTTRGVVTPIKNQEQCGSCWAFSAVASLEGQHALKTGHLVSLSEQNLVDCSAAEGDNGCEGGWMDNAFRYVILNHGIDTEATYAYKAIDESCRFKRQDVGATAVGFVDIPTSDEQSLKLAVATVGPISVAIDASNPSFQLYASGVYNEPDCSTTVLDHGVTAVGYGTLNGQDYWKVKNSWGTAWGEQGYILMSRNKQNQCGIATKASYPLV